MIRHPVHIQVSPIVPQLNYSMIGFLVVYGGYSDGRTLKIEKIGGIKRRSVVFVFAEENMWLTDERNLTVLNDNALISRWDNRSDDPPFLDSFASFHRAKDVDMNEGVSEAVFVDGHIQIVKFEETHIFAWPY